MTDSTERRPAPEAPPWAAGTEGREQEMFPILSEAEINTVREYAHEELFADGARLWGVGERDVPFYLVLEGALEIVAPGPDGDETIATHGRGSYTGETATMAGRGALVGGRTKGSMRALVVDTQSIRDLLALEAELGEKILQSFILRRMRMIANHLGDVILAGSLKSNDTARLHEFLMRNAIPHSVADPGTGEGAQTCAKLGIDPGPDGPVVVCGEQRLTRPTTKELADVLGISAPLSGETVYDVAVIGAGPSGLAASVYAASEGLKVVVFEKCAVGGQAGSSSRIENYLGFPTGISGQALTGRGFLQASKFGAEMAIARDVRTIACGDTHHRVVLEDGSEVSARAVVVAGGAVYRAPSLAGIEEFEGTHVHYGASHIQGMMCRDKHAVIIGGGNSAGQAAMFLSRHAASVTIVIRGPSLHHSMSDYLIRRIDRTENITVVPHTVCTELVSDGTSLSAVRTRNNETGAEEEMPCHHLFVFIGATPATAMLEGVVALDEKGFVKTGPLLSGDDLDAADWPLGRQPYLLETSCPRIFAVGDIRSGSVKRVASAVGEGSVCVQFVHQALTELGGDGG